MKEDIVFFHDSIGRGPFFHLEMTGVSWCDGSYRIWRNKSPYYAVEYIIYGSGYLDINGFQYRPREGDVYITTKGSRHVYKSSSGTPWVKIWVAFDGILADSLFEELSLVNVYHIKGCRLEDELRNIFNAAKRHVLAEHFHKESAVLVHDLLYRIYTHIKSIDEVQTDPVDHAIAFLRLNIHHTVTLEAIAKQAGKSPSQLSRLFKERTGKTPHAYFMEMKMARAKSFLSDSSLLVKQIAANLGFWDEFHFSKAFRKTVGMTPSEYRDRYSTERFAGTGKPVAV